MRIALSGSAGTGRTLIAQRLSQQLHLPMITGIAKDLLKQSGYAYSPNLSVEKFLATPERQQFLFKKRRALEKKHSGFVVDRSWVDQAAYAIIELHGCVEFDIDRYVEDCREEALKADQTVYVPWNWRPLTADGIRTLNPWYQLLVDSVIFNLLTKWKIPFITVSRFTSIRSAVSFITASLKQRQLEKQPRKPSRKRRRR